MINSTMKKTDSYNMHNGFYIMQKENIKSELEKICNPFLTEELENADCVYYDAYIFLKGICHIFAFALHEIFGYEIYEVRSNDNGTNHWFCQSYYQGKKIYIDVRGATTDYEEFLEEFQPLMGKKPIINLYENINPLDFKDEWEDNGIKFAKDIILKYYEYYLFC